MLTDTESVAESRVFVLVFLCFVLVGFFVGFFFFLGGAGGGFSCITYNQQQDMAVLQIYITILMSLTSHNETQNENKSWHLEEVEWCLDEQYKFFCGKIGNFRLMSLQILWNPIYGKTEKVVLISLASPEVRWSGLHLGIIRINCHLNIMCFCPCQFKCEVTFLFSL